jgi:hypothetical protein
MVAGCAASTPEDEGTSGDELDLTSGAAARQACGNAKFEEALPHYRRSVKSAKARLATDACGEDAQGNSAMRSVITNEAARAVFICPAFSDVIRKSDFAEPIRKAIRDMLTLKSLTGELLVLRDSEFANWTNVESFFPGTSMWATEDHGPLFIQDQLNFKANGEGVHVHLGDSGQDVKTPFTYRIEKTGGEQDPRKVIITRDGKTTTYNLDVRRVPASNFETAPVFELRAPNVSNRYTTSKDECSA